jgi:spore maturation protein CgeB
MRWILEHPREASEMGKRGREAVQHSYNWSVEATKLLDLYEAVLDGVDTDRARVERDRERDEADARLRASGLRED